MKNSAINLSRIQTLQEQAKQLLPLLTVAFSKINYSNISHQRLAQQNSNNTTNYQGLTRAQHTQFGFVMIKWELTDNNRINNDRSDNQNLSTLSHEANVSIALEKSQNIKNNAKPIFPIVPPVLAYSILPVQIFSQTQQLTILVVPYYKKGSLVHQLGNKNSNKHKQPLIPKQKCQLIIQSAYLIDNLHNSGWLHNDIKPSNILLDGFSLNNADSDNPTPILLLTDFALTQRLDKNFDRDGIVSTAGTPAYLAPECWQGHSKTIQSDIYAFGIMMYEVLTSGRPFNISKQSREPLKEWAIQHCQKPIPTLSKEYQCYQMSLNKALAKRVEKRYKTMDELLADLKDIKK